MPCTVPGTPLPERCSLHSQHWSEVIHFEHLKFPGSPLVQTRDETPRGQGGSSIVCTSGVSLGDASFATTPPRYIFGKSRASRGNVAKCPKMLQEMPAFISCRDLSNLECPDEPSLELCRACLALRILTTFSPTLVLIFGPEKTF